MDSFQLPCQKSIGSFQQKNTFHMVRTFSFPAFAHEFCRRAFIEEDPSQALKVLHCRANEHNEPSSVSRVLVVIGAKEQRESSQIIPSPDVAFFSHAVRTNASMCPACMYICIALSYTQMNTYMNKHISTFAYVMGRPAAARINSMRRCNSLGPGPSGKHNSGWDGFSNLESCIGVGVSGFLAAGALQS